MVLNKKRKKRKKLMWVMVLNKKRKKGVLMLMWVW